MKNKEYILFDLDGTITDSKEGIVNSILYALEKLAIEVEDKESLTQFVGPPLEVCFGEHFKFDDNKTKEAINLYREYYAETGLYENRLYEGIDEVLRNLKEKGKSIILATSKPTYYAEIIIENFKLKSYFIDIVGSNLDGTRTIKGDVIKFALENNNIAIKSKAVMVGDRNYDIIGAKREAIESIGVEYGFAKENELKEAGADYIVKTVKELSEILI